MTPTEPVPVSAKESANLQSLVQIPAQREDVRSSFSNLSPALNTRRSYESTPAETLLPPHPHDFNPSVRRGSAPAPLGVSHQVPLAPTVTSTYLPKVQPHLPRYSSSATPSVVHADNVHHSYRRGSLPASYLSEETCKAAYLPPVPSDPSIRRASLERSRLRLSSHPFAWQVASAHGAVPDLYNSTQYGQQFSSESSNVVGGFEGSPLEANLAESNGSYLPQPGVYNAYSPWEIPDDLLSQPRSRYQNEQAEILNHQMSSDIVPGPLPQPGYSFGTAPAPIPEDEVNVHVPDDMDEKQIQYRDVHSFPRFSSFTSTDSTASSAFYSDEQAGDLHDVYQTPESWQPDRRASWYV